MLPLDKQAHLLAGACIAFAFGAFGMAEHGVVAAVTIGGLKELYDGRHPSKHTSDVYDFYATAFGGIAAYAVVTLAKTLA